MPSALKKADDGNCLVMGRFIKKLRDAVPACFIDDGVEVKM